MPDVAPDALIPAFSGFRQLVLVHAGQGQTVQVLQTLAQHYQQQSLLCVLAESCASATDLEGWTLCQPGQSRTALGQEFDLVLLHLNQLRADDLAICSGLIPGGGLCVLLQTDEQALNSIAQRLLNALSEQSKQAQENSFQYTERQYTATEEWPSVSPLNRKAGLSALPEQQQALKALIQNALGRARRPLLISADRGRGKTAALGLAAASLLQEGKRIALVAKQPESVLTAFDLAVQQLQAHNISFKGKPYLLQLADAILQYIAPQHVLESDLEQYDQIWIDEAASLPVAFLKHCLKRYKHIAFISTIQGYEGTGKGFELKFKPYLQAHSQQWRHIQLTQPIRWQAGDPLERACQQALLLDASVELNHRLNQSAPQSLSAVSIKHCWTHTLMPVNARDEALLRKVWGLLSLSHYQTSPLDLQLLLEDKSMQLLLAQQEDELLGVVLFKLEGKVDAALAEQISLGKRRPKGHLLPQVFASQLGLPDALSLSSWRIIRIATRVDYYRQGIASNLLGSLQKRALKEGIDYLGSSFAATSDVASFWQKNDFLPIHLGRKQDVASGCHALAVSLPLSTRAAELTEQAYRIFHQSWPLLLNEYWQDLDNTSLMILMRQTEFAEPDLPLWVAQQIELFIAQALSFEAAFAALNKYLIDAIRQGEIKVLNEQQQNLAINKILRQQSWAEVSQLSGLSGKKACLEVLKEAFSILSQV